MIRFILATSLAITLAGHAMAATVNLSAYSWVGTLTEEAEDQEQSSHDTAIDGPLHYRTAIAHLPDVDKEAATLAGVDLSLGAGRARARLTKAPNTGETRGQATATTKVRERYAVSGTGKAQVNFTIYGDFSLLSDVPDLSKYFNAFGSMAIYYNGTTHIQRLSTADPTDLLFGIENGPFHRKMSYVFDVLDGDVFDVATLITADIRMFNDLVGAFDIQVDVKSGLRVFGHDGVDLIPSDGEIAAPVPLPAAAFLLISPLAGLAVIRRNRRRQA